MNELQLKLARRRNLNGEGEGGGNKNGLLVAPDIPTHIPVANVSTILDQKQKNQSELEKKLNRRRLLNGEQILTEKEEEQQNNSKDPLIIETVNQNLNDVLDGFDSADGKQATASCTDISLMKIIDRNDEFDGSVNECLLENNKANNLNDIIEGTVESIESQHTNYINVGADDITTIIELDELSISLKILDEDKQYVETTQQSNPIDSNAVKNGQSNEFEFSHDLTSAGKKITSEEIESIPPSLPILNDSQKESHSIIESNSIDYSLSQLKAISDGSLVVEKNNILDHHEVAEKVQELQTFDDDIIENRDSGSIAANPTSSLSHGETGSVPRDSVELPPLVITSVDAKEVVDLSDGGVDLSDGGVDLSDGGVDLSDGGVDLSYRDDVDDALKSPDHYPDGGVDLSDGEIVRRPIINDSVTDPTPILENASTESEGTTVHKGFINPIISDEVTSSAGMDETEQILDLVQNNRDGIEEAMVLQGDGLGEMEVTGELPLKGDWTDLLVHSNDEAANRKRLKARDIVRRRMTVLGVNEDDYFANVLEAQLESYNEQPEGISTDSSHKEQDKGATSVANGSVEKQEKPVSFEIKLDENLQLLDEYITNAETVLTMIPEFDSESSLKRIKNRTKNEPNLSVDFKFIENQSAILLAGKLLTETNQEDEKFFLDVEVGENTNETGSNSHRRYRNRGKISSTEYGERSLEALENSLLNDRKLGAGSEEMDQHNLDVLLNLVPGENGSTSTERRSTSGERVTDETVDPLSNSHHKGSDPRQRILRGATERDLVRSNLFGLTTRNQSDEKSKRVSTIYKKLDSHGLLFNPKDTDDNDDDDVDADHISELNGSSISSHGHHPDQGTEDHPIKISKGNSSTATRNVRRIVSSRSLFDDEPSTSSNANSKRSTNYSEETTQSVQDATQQRDSDHRSNEHGSHNTKDTTTTSTSQKLAEKEMSYQEFVDYFARSVELTMTTRRFLFSILGPEGDCKPPPKKAKVDYVFYGSEHLTQRCRSFFDDLQKKFASVPQWKDASEEKLLCARDCLEQYVMSRVGWLGFEIIEQKFGTDDALLLQRMKLLSFLEPSALDIKPEVFDETLLSLARNELKKINAFKTPGDKIACVVKCATIIFRSLSLCRTKVQSDQQKSNKNRDEDDANNLAGADDFLPLFIWVVLKSHIPKLFTNCEYIQDYLNPARLMGRSGYCLVNLRSAIEFINYLDAESINIDPDVFRSKMSELNE